MNKIDRVGRQKCYRHPGVETRLTCASCEQAMCSNCARQTPVAMKCANCVDTATPGIFKLTKTDLVLFVAIGAAIGVGSGFAISYFIDSIISSVAILWLRFLISIGFALTALATRTLIVKFFARKAVTQRQIIRTVAFLSMILCVGTYVLLAIYIHNYNDAVFQTLLLNFTVGIGLVMGFFLSSGFRRRR